MKRDSPKQIIFMAAFGLIPVVWLALIAAPAFAGGRGLYGRLPEVIDALTAALNNPLHIEWQEGSLKTAILFAAAYSMGIGIYLATRRNTRPRVEAAIEKQIRALREKALAAVKEIDPTLTAAQASQLAKLLPEGAATSFGQIAAIAPSFVTTVENKLVETRAADSYKEFKTLCDPVNIYVGLRKNETTDSAAGGLPDMGGIAGILGGLMGGDSGSNPIAALGGLAGGKPAADEGDPEPPPPYLFWLIVPSPNGQFAAIEFAEADSATFVYRTGGDFAAFARQLNRALEAIAFKREVIRLSDEELRKPENADYYMAAKRTAALQFVRANFIGRVIHTGADAWRRKLTGLWNGEQK
jgi:hypothetical protein